MDAALALMAGCSVRCLVFGESDTGEGRNKTEGCFESSDRPLGNTASRPPERFAGLSPGPGVCKLHSRGPEPPGVYRATLSGLFSLFGLALLINGAGHTLLSAVP